MPSQDIEMMSHHPKLSVVIPTYNRPESLANCLKSFEEQILAPFEVIVVVDGELTSHVQKAIDTFKNSGNFNIVQVNNYRRMGGPASKNIGADFATGDIVAFVDDDITLVPDWTLQILKGYEEHKDAAGVGGMVSEEKPHFANIFYRYFTEARVFLFRGKVGKMTFIGLPYLAMVFPVDGLKKVDFLHLGNISLRREIMASHKLDLAMGNLDEFDLGIRLSRLEKRKLIYNPKAIAYHHHNRVGGIELYGSERLCHNFKEHIPYLMKDFNLKYWRLAIFALAVFALSIITLKPEYVKAILDGWKLYQNQKSKTEKVKPARK